jgi:hypothetical protein
MRKDIGESFSAQHGAPRRGTWRRNILRRARGNGLFRCSIAGSVPGADICPNTPEQVLQDDFRVADQVFIATAVSADSFTTNAPPFVKTNVHLNVLSNLRGSGNSVYVINGGTVGDQTMIAPHSPPFEIGKTFLTICTHGYVNDIFPMQDGDNVVVRGVVLSMSEVSQLLASGAP